MAHNKKPVKKRQRKKRDGRSRNGRGGFRRLTVPEHLRWKMFDALVKLHREFGRPVMPEEIAAELGLPPEKTHPWTLRSARYADVRQYGDRQGFVPADVTATRIDGALAALEATKNGSHDYRIRSGPRWETKSLTIDASFKSRIRKLAARVKSHLKITSWKSVTSDRIPHILTAVYEVEMGRSPVPRLEWEAQTVAAKKARKNALNRQSDMRRFLEWAQHEGHADLRFLALFNRSREPMLSREWASFTQPLHRSPGHNTPLTFARRAMEFGAGTPEALAEMGFHRFREWLLNHDRFGNRNSAASALGRYRLLWEEGRANHPHLPHWPPPTRYMQDRLDDGGLVRTWWSAGLFMDGKPSLLDESGMEEQLSQAVDMRDWWTMADPTARATSAGGPLPPRPKVARQGGRRIGARTEDAQTAGKPLWTVSRFQRFAITEDPVEAQRIDADRMREVRWEELFFDSGRVQRFIRHELQCSADEHDGTLVKTAGTDAALYVPLLAEVYFPAFVSLELERLEREEMDLPETDQAFRRQREIGRERKRLLRKRADWADIAEKAIELFRSEEVRLGGFQPWKDKDHIAENLSHEDLGRIADVFRHRRLDAEGQLRRRSSALVQRREQLRRLPCEADADGSPCAVVGCDEHLPLPELRLGIAKELVGRTYAFLVMKELWMRLPPLLPWRPSEFARLRVGRHLDPATLEVNALRYKNPRTGSTVVRRRAHLPSIEPIAGMDPDATEKMVEVLMVCIEIAQPFLAAHPTEQTRKAKAAIRHNDEHLFLTKTGRSVRNSKGLATMIASILEEGAKAVNASLKEGDEPIKLPSGWGARGAQVFRFLWGHRSVELGASMSSVATALGNTERTTRDYYQKVRSDSAVNAVARDTRERNGAGAASSEAARAPDGGEATGYDEELDVLCTRFERGLLDRQEFDDKKAALRARYGRP